MRQPQGGYRIALDTVLLAAASGAEAGMHVVDVGAGVGGVALVAARLADGVRVTAIEREPALAALLAHNARINGLAERVGAVVGDVAACPLRPATADVVLTNPPYGAKGRGTLPAGPIGRRARHEGTLDLAGWLEAAATLVRPGGHLVLVHRADRLGELLGLLPRAVAVLPLWPRAGVAARRVLLRARIGRGGSAALLPGLVLHGPEGHFTPEADAILRGRASLSWE